MLKRTHARTMTTPRSSWQAGQALRWKDERGTAVWKVDKLKSARCAWDREVRRKTQNLCQNIPRLEDWGTQIPAFTLRQKIRKQVNRNKQTDLILTSINFRMKMTICAMSSMWQR